MVDNLPLQVHPEAPLETSMKDKLQPKLPCHTPQKPRDHSSQSTSPYARKGVAPVKGLVPIDILTKDLECSSSSEDSSDLEDHPAEQSKPLMDPNEVVHLDGMKLRINLRLVKKEEAKLKTRPRRNSESSSTSCSMEEEDLPLLDDDILSEVSFGSSSSSSSSPAAKRHKFGSANDATDDVNEDQILWLPYRPPSPNNQEDFVKREIEGMREYDTWLELRRLLYSRFIPVEDMPTNMQPRVVLKRSRAIDKMALGLMEDSKISATASSENNSSDPVSSTSSIQLPSLEELTGGPACADEPTLQSLLDDLDDFSFSSTNCETDVFEQTTTEGAILPCDSFVKSAFVDHFLPNDCAVDDIPNVEAPTRQPDKISNKEANLSCTILVQEGPKKTVEVELIHVPCDAACGTKEVAEAAAVKTPAPLPPLPPPAMPIEELVLQTVSAVNFAEKITATKSNPLRNLPSTSNQTANISPQLSSSDLSEEDDAIHFYISDEDEFFNV